MNAELFVFDWLEYRRRGNAAGSPHLIPMNANSPAGQLFPGGFRTDVEPNLLSLPLWSLFGQTGASSKRGQR